MPLRYVSEPARQAKFVPPEASHAASVRKHHRMTEVDVDALIEKLFPVTATEMLRDLASLDFSIVVPSKVTEKPGRT
jgi:hypothetical protein